MREYFTNLQFCPNCFEPFKSDVKLKEIEGYDDIIYCPSCNSFFKKNIKYNGEYFPLLSEIKLNIIESSYVDWILNGIRGKFIITWPWDDVKFIPILLSQYLYEHPNSRIVIFFNSNYFKQKYNIFDMLNSLYFMNNENLDDSKEELDIDDIFIKYDFNSVKSLNKNISKSFFKCFNNIHELIPCFFDINISIINSKEDIDIKTNENQLIFINDSIFSRDIVNLIKEIDPNLIISENIDNLFGENRFRKHHPIFDLFKTDFNMLFFSTELSKRSFHNIGNEKYFLKNWDIIRHTWDNNLILDKILELDDNNFYLFSSNMLNTHKYANDFEINFIECEELGKIENTFDLFHSLFFQDKNIEKTLEDLIKSPLNINGLYHDKKVLNRNITFEYLFSIIYNRNPEIWESLIRIFDEVYGFKSTPKNPLMQTLLNTINDLNHNDFVIIVHPFDVKGTKIILDEMLGENNIIVTSFNKLNNDVGDKSIEHGISTLFPPRNYNVKFPYLKKLDIVCSPFNKQRFEAYRKNGFTEIGIKPIYLLKSEEDAPPLLKELLSEITIPEKYFYNIVETFDYGTDIYFNSFNMFKHPNLKEGDNAILIINEDGYGMFLKFNHMIYLLDDNGEIDDPTISVKYNYKELEKKCLLVNNSYYNPVFLSYVLKYGSDIILREKYNFKWNGFKELVESMFLWVNSLHKIIEYECKISFKSSDEVKSKLATSLSHLGLSAKGENYIKNNWLKDPEIIKIGSDQILSYGSAERPRTEKDMIKIMDWITKNYDDFYFTRTDAKKSYAASRKLKNIRKNFLKTGSMNLSPALNRLKKDFKDFMNSETNFFDNFNIVSSQKVVIKKDVSPFEIIENYKDYIS